MSDSIQARRVFLKRCLAGCGAAWIGVEGVRELVLGLDAPALGVGFRNDASGPLPPNAVPAAFAWPKGHLVECRLCPHRCVLGENDRGFCRTRVVKNGQLFSEGYSNLCAIALDPIEKKPLYHFHPRTQILSVAIGGCNLRCLNCQNWEISQACPGDVARETVTPGELVEGAVRAEIPSIAYTYSEPLVWYEYVRDTAARARERGLKNVLVTAGYVEAEPIRRLAKLLDAVTLDLKAFGDRLFVELSGGRLQPVLDTLRILREEGVWIEVSFLMVPTFSSSAEEIAKFGAWVVKNLGAGTPFHILRFHAAHRLETLPPTPVTAMEEALRRVKDVGLEHVYLGNVPGHDANHTRCPRCGRTVVERRGFEITRYELAGRKCPCGQPISGVFDEADAGSTR